MTNSMYLHPDLEMSFSKLAIDLAGGPEAKEECPKKYLCPVTGSMLVDPVLVRAECNHTVSRSCFQDWLKQGNKSCPVCQAPLKALYAKTNKELKNQVQTYQFHRSQMTLMHASLLSSRGGAAAATGSDHTPLRSNGTHRKNSGTAKRTPTKRGRRVALKVKPELQLEIQAHGARGPVGAIPEQTRLEKEESHGTLETMDLSFSGRNLMGDDSMQDDSGRIHGSDSPNNWEDSCTSIDNIRCRIHRAPTSPPTRGMVYKVTNNRPRGNSPAPQRNQPLQRLLHAMNAVHHGPHATPKNNTIKARPPMQLPMRLPFGSPLVTIGPNGSNNKKDKDNNNKKDKDNKSNSNKTKGSK